MNLREHASRDHVDVWLRFAFEAVFNNDSVDSMIMAVFVVVPSRRICFEDSAKYAMIIMINGYKDSVPLSTRSGVPNMMCSAMTPEMIVAKKSDISFSLVADGSHLSGLFLNISPDTMANKVYPESRRAIRMKQLVGQSGS